MDQYELYCLTDGLVYDTPGRPASGSADFAVAARRVPEGWQRTATDVWMSYAPREIELPPQGWKIHVSSRVEDAERALETVWDYCVPRGLAFKFLRSHAVMVMFNSKSAFRGSSGKLVTIYPRDVAELELVLKELDELMTGVEGPYILSDLRYGDGPLFVRYGGFTPRYCLDGRGARVLALENDLGELVPDVRGPVFATPPWVPLPEFLEPHLAARNAVTVSGLPYAIESVVQFSNGGGVYLGRVRTTGERVLLKEGRPFAGLDVAGRDAVERVIHERDIMRRLSGLDSVPAVHDHFTVGDHHFLVVEFVDSVPLQRVLVMRYPLTHPDPAPDEVAGYTTWALEMLDRVGRAVDALHERGVVFGDLHPDNVLVGTDDRLVLVDFEVSTLVADDARPALAHPGYAAPADRQGADVDRYALACLCLGLFAPQTTTMLTLHPAKCLHLAELIAETFPVPRATLDRAVRTILGARADDASTELRSVPMPGAAEWEHVRDAMCRAMVASATPGREDRLFPGDIAQFQPGGGVNVAHGAAGVLYALASTGAGRFPEYEDWLCARALAADQEAGPGFYAGLHGVAYVLEELGRRQDALDTMERCLGLELDAPELGLYSGIAGVALSLLHLGDRTGDRAFHDAAWRLVDVTADRLGGPEDVPVISGGDHPRAGLLHGSSGPALLFLRAYERDRDPALLDLAATALRQDLRRCIRAEDGTLQVNQDWRTLPYLDEGSVGIAVVLARYLTHRRDEAFQAALGDLLGVIRARYFVQSGLFTGRSGLIAAAGMMARSGLAPGRVTDADLTELVRRLAWHALPYGGGLAFPGDQLLRLSMDFATGTAGVLFAVGTVLHERPVFLPFLEPPADASHRRTMGPAGRLDPDHARKEV
ncbi:lantipeptide synthetase [Jiangella aurantiaca]|uniref:non-specific serine/threonine protein kinase n=1 Tax=Jiangella aurantiaca TaxID=2530373 RepID=A0A4R5AEW7_9ACTN|nr:lantipeptide synthetase [Jiangella aurantiaca]